MITEIYSKYFQKSTAFLYPLLGIAYASSIKPERTFLSWDNYFTTDDSKLLCLYQLRSDKDYITFERSKLLNNSLFCKFEELEDNKAIYVFDFSSFKEDYKYFINGNYSLMDESIKLKILSYYLQNSLQREYIQSYLFPENYFKIYANILGVDEKLLRKVQELCSKPDLEQELLTIKINNYEQNNDVNINRV
jgi:hypothetical protein